VDSEVAGASPWSRVADQWQVGAELKGKRGKENRSRTMRRGEGGGRTMRRRRGSAIEMEAAGMRKKTVEGDVCSSQPVAQ
jgi:hypothetical protein